MSCSYECRDCDDYGINFDYAGVVPCSIVLQSQVTTSSLGSSLLSFSSFYSYFDGRDSRFSIDDKTALRLAFDVLKYPKPFHHDFCE